MLTVMCPNCGHRFPATGCCEPSGTSEKDNCVEDLNNLDDAKAYYGGILVPRGYTSGGDCMINAPTIIHGPAIIQSDGRQCGSITRVLNDSRVNETLSDSPKGKRIAKRDENGRIEIAKTDHQTPSICRITTTCDLTGGSVTIATPSIQSGGCFIQSSDSYLLVQTPHVEIRPKLSGGGCLVQTKLSTEEQPNKRSTSYCNVENVYSINRTNSPIPPSGCQELPGIRRSIPPKIYSEKRPIDEDSDYYDSEISNDCLHEAPERHRMLRKEEQHSKHRASMQREFCCRAHQPSKNFQFDSFNGESRESLLLHSSNGIQIQVQLPANLGQCSVNITATSTNTPAPRRCNNNFNGGGIVGIEEKDNESNERSEPNDRNSITYNNERREETPTTPVSWVMPCPWGFDTYLMDKDRMTLWEVKKLLQVCGWYHEGLSWQQSEKLLKNTTVGRWLMRDSSDSRFTFAVSVQTARGPTSVRVHYFLGRFRLDAEPTFALAMPLFDCPIKMLEYYVEYSKRMDEQRREVWVDYSGQLYSQIYLTKPLVKEVRSLSHLARLAVNRNKLPTENLPTFIKNYLAEYPYTL